MNINIHRPDQNTEFPTDERCSILEIWNDESDNALSIARARVAPGITTQWHRLRDVDERYHIVAGTGCVRLGMDEPREVVAGDVVVIPAGTAQQITNSGPTDLIFYCICTPRFTPDCYESLD